MIDDYATLHKNALEDALITAHLLQHRSSPTVSHLLVGINHLRCRDRNGQLSKVLTAAERWATTINLPKVDELDAAIRLWSALAAPAKALETYGPDPNPSHLGSLGSSVDQLTRRIAAEVNRVL